MSLAIIETRKFSTHVVLCIATEIIPDAKLMPEIYSLLEFLTGGPVSTSQLSQAMHEANRFLTHRNPRLLLDWEKSPRDPESVQRWFRARLADEGEQFPVIRH